MKTLLFIIALVFFLAFLDNGGSERIGNMLPDPKPQPQRTNYLYDAETLLNHPEIYAKLRKERK